MGNDRIREDMLKRIRTVKGHVAGIEKMIEEGKDCEDVILQLAAVRSSIEKIGTSILENNAYSCLTKESNSNEVDKEKLEKIIKAIIKFLK